ncbi:MAG: YgiQ family radical SAM protein [Chloroflexota bacterium]|nr:YgiQ family radical SAM protein [Chloroflexota bacterium]
MFLPTTKQELGELGWKKLDVILVTGDSYVDSPFVGVSVIGKVLVEAGYRVGIIAQPDVHSDRDISRLGEPELFWGVTGGCIDSMVANYTATKKRKKTDDMTPGGKNDRRPDRAVIVYTNLIRRFFKRTKPIVLGGVEASLRRVAHYDYWSDNVRRSILFDAKADLLVYGMAEKTVVALAECLSAGGGVTALRGICYISQEKINDYIELPSYAAVAGDESTFINMFHTFYRNNDPHTARGLCQKQDTRYLVQNPPAPYLTQRELDEVYGLDFERDLHPFYERQGSVKALETIKFSITTHRGCYGECNFCSIAVHQGRTVRWRGQTSILREAKRLTEYPDFKGYIQDVGGPTANMYGFECEQKLCRGSCADKRCLYPEICPQLRIQTNHDRQITLLRNLGQIEGIKKIYIASGIRYDLLLADEKSGYEYLRQVVQHHVSGQMKIAPEHTEDRVLRRMGKPGKELLLTFKDWFYKLTRAAGKEQFLTYYLIAAHPGCTERDMWRLKRFASRELGISPEQVQVFTPTPSTYSTLMYYTEMDPFTGEKIFVEKAPAKKERQKQIVTEKRTRKRDRTEV